MPDFRRAPKRTRRWPAASMSLAALMPLPLAARGATQSEAGVCASEARAQELGRAQDDVIDLLRPAPGVDLTTLHDEADLAELAALGYDFYPHQQTSVRGMGWPVLDTTGATAPGRPSLLLYGPSGHSVTAPRDGFDFPYRLAGWAYLFGYDPDERPRVLSCLGDEDWFVHERGIHTFDDGDFDPVRPRSDDPRGTAAGDDVPCATDPVSGVFCTDRQPGDFGHPRSWDTHLWLDGDDVPTVSMTNPGHKLAGIDAQIGHAFFFPETDD